MAVNVGILNGIALKRVQGRALPLKLLEFLRLFSQQQRLDDLVEITV